MKKPILIFDLADTLVGGLNLMTGPASQRLGVPEESIIPALVGDSLTALLEGKSTEKEYWEAILSQNDWRASSLELGDLVREAFGQEVPGMPELVARLTDYTLVLLSDHAREWMQFIDQQHDFLKIFDFRFISFEMKQTKRAVETFHHVASELKTSPGNCLFVDDLQGNIDRASAAGYDALRFTTTEALRLELRKRGIGSPNCGGRPIP
jgi:HAD superfamily hydrolase (TIGR01509 family)